MKRRRKSPPLPVQLGIDLIEGAETLARVTIWSQDSRLLARVLREMAQVLDTRETRELTASDIKTLLKFD